MKNLLPGAILAMILISGTLPAQKQLCFGLSLTGLTSVITNQNNYGLDFELDYVATFGGCGNVNIGFDFNKRVGLKTEIGFTKLGQKYKGTHDGSAYQRNIRLNYLQIPLMFKYIGKGDAVNFYLMAGPQCNLLLSASQQYLKDGAVFDYYHTLPDSSQTILVGQQSITGRYNSLDIMGRIDLGAEIRVASNLFLNVGMTMAYGIIDINAPDWQIPDYSSGEYHSSHNIYGGINFGINYMLPVGNKN